MSRRFAVGALALALVACGGNVSSNGLQNNTGAADGASSSSGSSGGASSGGAGAATSGSGNGSSAVPGPNAQVSLLSGTYTGYIESYRFPDGSDVVVMKVDLLGDSTVKGTVYFGRGSPLPPATDPNIGYPPGLGASSQVSFVGFDFTVLGGTYAAPRVQLSIFQTEIWKHWCEIQTMIYPVDNGNAQDGGCGTALRYGCLPNAATQYGPPCAISWCQQPAWTPIDCGKLSLCALTSVCTCTATACTIPVPTKGNITFDMHLSSGALDGSVSGLDTQVHNVHLMRGP